MKTNLNSTKSTGFIKGILLNGQYYVLIFWLQVSPILSAKQILSTTCAELLLFVAGVGLAKMSVLKGYAYMAKK